MSRVRVIGPSGVGGEVTAEDGTSITTITIGQDGEIQAFAADGAALEIDQIVPDPQPETTATSEGDGGAQDEGSEESADGAADSEAAADDDEEHGDA